MSRLLDSMSFQRFIEERGPSYRNCDVFDDLYAEIQSQLKEELDQQTESPGPNSRTMRHLRQIAEKLYKYEYPQSSVSANLGTPTNANGHLHHSHKTARSKEGHGGAKVQLLSAPNRSCSKIKMPTPDAYKRIHSETFPFLHAEEIQRLITNNLQHQVNLKSQDIDEFVF